MPNENNFTRSTLVGRTIISVEQPSRNLILVLDNGKQFKISTQLDGWDGPCNLHFGLVGDLEEVQT